MDEKKKINRTQLQKFIEIGDQLNKIETWTNERKELFNEAVDFLLQFEGTHFTGSINTYRAKYNIYRLGDYAIINGQNRDGTKIYKDKECILFVWMAGQLGKRWYLIRPIQE